MKICHHCENMSECKAFRYLCDMSRDFDIKHCANYEDAIPYKYKRIAEHDELMQVIYDYFTGQIAGDFSEAEVREAITRAIWAL